MVAGRGAAGTASSLGQSKSRIWWKHLETLQQSDSNFMFIESDDRRFVLGFCMSFIFKFRFSRNSFLLCFTKVLVYDRLENKTNWSFTTGSLRSMGLSLWKLVVSVFKNFISSSLILC